MDGFVAVAAARCPEFQLFGRADVGDKLPGRQLTPLKTQIDGTGAMGVPSVLVRVCLQTNFTFYCQVHLLCQGHKANCIPEFVG